MTDGTTPEPPPEGEQVTTDGTTPEPSPDDGQAQTEPAFPPVEEDFTTLSADARRAVVLGNYRSPLSAAHEMLESSDDGRRLRGRQAQLTDTGGDPQTGILWGRWSHLAGQGPSQHREIHWMAAPQTEIPPALPRSGTYRYNLAGGTRPTDNAGNVGRLNAAELNVDFNRALVDAELDLSVANIRMQLDAAEMPIVESGFRAGADATTPLEIQCPACAGMPSGELTGRFTGPTGEGAITGYQVQNGAQEISGTAAFRREDN